MFYANLFDGAATKENLWLTWNMILAWMKSRGITSHYGALYSLDKDWENHQVAWVTDHEVDFVARYGGPSWQPRGWKEMRLQSR